jgi:hypothetical protein
VVRRAPCGLGEGQLKYQDVVSKILDLPCRMATFRSIIVDKQSLVSSDNPVELFELSRLDIRLVKYALSHF